MSHEELFARWEAPVGRLLLVGRAVRRESSGRLELAGLYFDAAPHAARAISAEAREDRAAFDEIVTQLEAYFEGRLKTFEITLAPRGTMFQREVWSALATIPYGTTTTYAEIARAIGKPRAVRAVGAANGRNPLSIVVPCHRVIGRDGTLTGYAGGVENKRSLLDLESRHSV